VIEILNRYTKAVVYKSETATTVAEAVVEAVDSKADLRSADLRSADLRSANLSSANLRSADLRFADLRSADLSSASLSFADLSSVDAARLMACPSAGAFTAFKKCSNGVIVKVLIPEESRRSSATGRKCRAEFVDVLEVFGAEFGVSKHDQKTRYEVGNRVTCDSWCEDRWQECVGGIHFFITREEAEDYLDERRQLDLLPEVQADL